MTRLLMVGQVSTAVVLETDRQGSVRTDGVSKRRLGEDRQPLAGKHQVTRFGSSMFLLSLLLHLTDNVWVETKDPKTGSKADDAQLRRAPLVVCPLIL